MVDFAKLAADDRARREAQKVKSAKLSFEDQFIHIPVDKSQITPYASDERPGTVLELLQEVYACKQATRAAKRAEDRLKVLALKLQSVIQVHGTEGLTSGGKPCVELESPTLGQKFVLTVQPRSSLDKKLLINAGVTPEQIQAGTKTTDYPQVNMRPVGGEDVESDD